MNSADDARMDPIRLYLAQLELALDGCDPALRHDALIDAEEHLHAAIAAGVAPAQAISEYGTPEEIAGAYRTSSGPRPGSAPSSVRPEAAPMAEPATVGAAVGAGVGNAAATGAAPPKRRLRNIPVVGIWFHPVAWRALAYFGVVGFPLATSYFVWAVTIGSFAIGTLPLVLGLPVVVFLLGSARALSLFEGKVVEFFLGVRMPRRTQPVAGVVVDGVAEVGFWHRIWCWLRDVRSWLSLGYLVGNFPVSLAAFVMTLVLTLTGFVMMAVPVLDLVGIPMGCAELDEGERIQFLFTEVKPDEDGRLWLPDGTAIPSFLIGFALLTATLWLVRGLGWIYGHVIQAIQVARPRPVEPAR